MKFIRRFRDWLQRGLGLEIDPQTRARLLDVEIAPGVDSLAGGTHIGCGGRLKPVRFKLATGVVHPLQCDLCGFCWYAAGDLALLRKWVKSFGSAKEAAAQMQIVG